jgi:hypothetical protein
MDKYNFTYTDMKFDKNFYIKNVNIYGDEGNKSWIYKINNITYYIPCKGDLLLIDHDYHDFTNSDKEYKIISKDIFNDEKDIKNIIKNHVINCINSSIFDGISTQPEDIKTLFTNINNDLNHTNSYDKIIEKYFMKYIHNRVGTALRDNEKQYIKKYDIKPFIKGQLVIYEEKYDTYIIVLFLENKDEFEYNCISLDNNKYTEISCSKDLIYHYSEHAPILPDIKQGQNGQSTDDIIETYIL